jgi:hypothetical protein
MHATLLWTFTGSTTITAMSNKDVARARRAVFMMLNLAFAEERGANDEASASVFSKVVDLLARHDERLRGRREKSSDASLLFDVVVPVYRLVEAGDLNDVDAVRHALDARGEKLGFRLDDDTLNDLVVLGDEIKGKGGAVDAAVAAFAARTGTTKRGVYKRLSPVSSKFMRKRGLFSATPPSRMKYGFTDLMNLSLYAVDVLHDVGTLQGSTRAAERLRAGRAALIRSATELGAGCAPPSPPPPAPAGRVRRAVRPSSALRSRRGEE